MESRETKHKDGAADLSQGEYSTWAKFWSNKIPTTWREWLGRFLRDLAEVIDGDASISVGMLSLPPLTEEHRTILIRTAMHDLKEAFFAAVDEHGKEEAYKEMVRLGYVKGDEFHKEAHAALSAYTKKP